MTTDTTPAAIEAMLKDVTPGPWEHDAPTVWGENPRVSGPDGILVAEAGNATHDYDTFDANARFIAAARDLVPALAAERDAALTVADALPAVEVGVRELEWCKVAPYGLHEAYGLCWKYQIREGTDAIVRWQAGHMGAWFEAANVDTAKAAAQADYAARIRSALTVQPSPDVAGLVEALRSTLNFIENTEGEMGVILGCGDKARAALARMKEAGE